MTEPRPIVKARLEDAGGSEISAANPLPVTSEVGVESGTATSGSNITLEDTAKSWQVDIWEDAILEVEIGGIQYTREIDSNTADTLTFAALPGAVVVAAGCPYRIKMVAGQTVAISSGNIAVVSGNVAVISGEIHVMSGQLIAKVSGETVIAKVSGEIVYVSGQPVKVSGQIVYVSGQPVKVSGQTVVAKVSGQVVVVESGLYVMGDISGQIVYVSGQPVKVSGQTVIAKVSGQVVVVESGLYVMGDISGQIVYVSGQPVKVSGQTVITSVSGNVVVAKVSGEVMQIAPPTEFKTGLIRIITDASGGEVLHSGAVKAAQIKSLATNSGVIAIGGATNRPWYQDTCSGLGFVLDPGEVKSEDIDNFNRLYVVAQVSGDQISFAGVN